MAGAENVMKQGYLKKGTSGIVKLSNLFKRLDSNKWFVFTIRGRVPYLEYYDRDVDVFTQEPINSFNLSACSNIKSLGASRPLAFCVVCADRVIELIAPSRNQMLEWVNVMETSLRRLGILKREVEDHVYTVCPAVVRQPRVTKEVQEEKDTEQAARDTTTSVEDAPVVMRESSESEHCGAKPVIPSRPRHSNHYVHQRPKSFSPSWTPSVPGRSQDEEEDGDHSIAGGSNDSDFVSPDVIREIRRSRSHGVSAIAECDEIHATHCQVAAYFANAHNESEEETLTVPKTSAISTSSIDQVSNESFDTDSFLAIANMNRNSDPVENPYSELPGNLNRSSISSEVDYQNHSSCVQAEPQSVPKPVPRPRKAVTKRFIDEEETVEVNGFENFSTDVANHLSYSDVQGSENSIGALNGIGEFESSVLGIDFSNVDFSKKEDSNVNLDFLENKAEEKDQSSKDENENIYGLTFDPCRPPSTLAPPIPPLPPRHESLASTDTTCSPGIPSQHSQHLTTSTACQTDTKVSLSSLSSTGPPLFHLEDVAPPLPQPRKRDHKCLSAFTANGPIDIPPMPPRRRSPIRSASSDEKPPAIPSRHTQSFVIKRPQLMKSVTTEGDCRATAAHPQSTTSDRGVTNHTAPQAVNGAAHADSGKGSSGLSRKMLLDRSHSMHTVVSLKQTQAEILQHEIGMICVTVTLTQKSGHGLALVDWMDSPCIVGWNQKDFHSLHGKLHIGDLLFSVNKVRVTSADMAQKLLKQSSDSQIEVVLRRMPYAKVYAIRRNAEGQSLGIKREGGTGEIVYIDPNGLAAQHGLSQHATSVRGNTRCNWFLTEINNRSLNLFFKENEIDHRLSAVGREISVVVQPSDFIFEIRKLFKKLKSYKNFIVQ